MTPEQFTEFRQTRYNGTVVGLRKVHSDLMMIRVKPDAPKPPHEPGQYGTLGLGNFEPRMPGCQEETLKDGDEAKIVLRAYSISCPIYSEPGKLIDMFAQDYIEFYIVLVREGTDPAKAPALTPRLFMLKEGDRISIGKKIGGHYTLHGVQPNQNVIFLSTGTGEAPHNFMLWELMRREHKGKMLSACCVRYQKDLGYLQTHHDVEQHNSQYRYLQLTTREAKAGQKVYIQDLITSGELENALGSRLDPENTHVFLCGNPKMIGIPHVDSKTGEKTYPETLGVIQILEERGFKADDAKTKLVGNIHFEKYW